MIFAQVTTTPTSDGLGALATQGILGTLLVIAFGALVWLTLRRERDNERHAEKIDAINERRIAAAHDFANRVEASAERDRTAQSELARGMGQLAEAQREANRVGDRNTLALEAHTRVIESTIRDAVRRKTAESGADHPAIPRRDGRRDG